MNNTVGIIQARIGSSRFPGKMLQKLGDAKLLEWVLHRCLKSTRTNHFVLATSTEKRDDPLADIAADCNVTCYRGSENDVLSRFLEAARLCKADTIVRICADNPFIAPEEIDRLVAYFLAEPCDYACNHQDRLGSRYADGFGAEILHLGTLERIAEQAKAQKYREHVTLYLWDHEEDFSLLSVPAPEGIDCPDMRFDVDTREDLEYLEKLIAAGVSKDTAAVDIVGISQGLAAA